MSGERTRKVKGSGAESGGSTLMRSRRSDVLADKKASVQSEDDEAEVSSTKSAPIVGVESKSNGSQR